MSNLCQEITLPTYPLQHIDDEYGEIALCILSAINIGKVNSDKELEEMCDFSVRSLDELIDYQNYPIKAAEMDPQRHADLLESVLLVLPIILLNLDSNMTLRRHGMLSINFQNLFNSSLLKSSNQLAKEKGHCEYFGRTKYADGILPIDTYKKDVDEISTQKLIHDWEDLRASITEHGLRHSTLSAQMPSESSSVVSNETNGIEPPRNFLSVKKSKKGPQADCPSIWNS